MEPLDIDALLAKNPKVDRDAIKRASQEGKPSHSPAPRPPVRGRRLLLDDRPPMDGPIRKKPRSSYSTF
jgi:hypothetical protein